MIETLDNNDLSSLTNLYYFDLSRNNIANIVTGTFLGLKQLRKLDLSVNSLRTIEDDAFEGLDNLEGDFQDFYHFNWITIELQHYQETY
ncbi:hypothetical protein Trydic_g6931 [Trypoxylus dichotomus]